MNSQWMHARITELLLLVLTCLILCPPYLCGQAQEPRIVSLVASWSRNKDYYPSPGFYYFAVNGESYSVYLTDLAIDSVEVTQAIQEAKSPLDLSTWLQSTPPPPLNLGDMPVPLVGGKRGLLRIYLKEVSQPVQATVAIRIHGSDWDYGEYVNGASVVQVRPGCTPREARLHLQNSGNWCHSIDFYWDGEKFEAGIYRAWVVLGVAVPGLDFHYSITAWPGEDCYPPHISNDGFDNSDPFSLVGRYTGGVSWCLFDPIHVNKPDRIVLYPISICHDKDHLDSSCGDVGQISEMSQLIKHVAPTGSLTLGGMGGIMVEPPNPGETGDAWWQRMIRDLEKMASMYMPPSVSGERHMFYGVVHPNAPGGTTGIGKTLGRSAASRSSVTRFPPVNGQSPKLGQNVETNVGTMAHEIGHVLGLMHTDTGVPWSDAEPGCDGIAKVDPYYKTHFNERWSFWPYSDRGNFLFSGTPANPKLEVGLDFLRNRVRGPWVGDPYQSFEMMGYCSPRWVTPWSYRAMYGELLSSPSPVSALASVRASATQQQFTLVSGTVTDSGVSFDPIFTVNSTGQIDLSNGSYQLQVLNNSGVVLYTRLFTPVVSSSDGESDNITSLPHFSELLPVQPGAASITVLDDTGVQIGSVQFGGTAPTVKILFPTGGEVLQGTRNISWSVTDPDSSNHFSQVEYSADNGTNWLPLTATYQNTVLPINFDRLPGADGTGLIRVYTSDGVNTGQATSNPFSVPKKLPQAKISFPSNGDVFHVGDLLNFEGFGFSPDSGFLSGASMAWNAPDFGGAIRTGDAVSLGYLDASALGTHTISLTATDAAGNQATDSITIAVQEQVPVVYPDEPPVANAGGPYAASEGSPIVFWGGGSYASDLTDLTYAWSFGDGGTSSDQSPSRTFVDNGSYQVTLTITDQKGRTDTATATATISNVAPTVVAGAAVTGKTTRPINLSASFSDSGLQDAPWRVSWSFGDGSTSPITSNTTQGAVSISHIYQTVGQFNATVTVVDKDGGSGSATIPVTVISIADLNSDGKVDCADLAIVKASFGKKTGQAGFDARADVNGDGIVNVLDLSTVARQLPKGTICP